MKISFQKKEQSADTVRGMKVPYTASKRKAVAWRWYLILLVISSPLLYFLVKLILSQVIVTAQGFISLEKVAVNSTAAGTIQKLYVEVGQELKSGSTIALLYDGSLESRKIMLESELAELDGVKHPHDESKEAYLKKKIRATNEILQHEKRFYDNVAFLFNQGAATIAELRSAREGISRAQLDYDHALFEMERYFENRHKHPSSQPGQGVDQRRVIQARMNALDQQRSRLIQTLPYNGRILDIFAHEGEAVSTGTSILLLGRSDRPSAIAYLSPEHGRYARKGQKAIVKLPDGKALQARVSEDAKLTKRLPADLSSPIGSRDLMLLVNLEFAAELPGFQWVDGLPVSIRFKNRFF